VQRREALFHPSTRGTATDRFMRAGMLRGGGREGDFFMMIARTPA
jgi:hypothetical protein